MLVKNLLVWLISSPPLKKKKLALSDVSSKHLRAIVQAIVDFLSGER
jgi:hypothetical protein